MLILNGPSIHINTARESIRAKKNYYTPSAGNWGGKRKGIVSCTHDGDGEGDAPAWKNAWRRMGEMEVLERRREDREKEEKWNWRE
jgi:hypothetical protein